MVNTLLTVTFISFVAAANSSVDYCKLKCGKKHTLCATRPCLPRDRCESQFKSLPLDNNERHIVVNFHNNLRNWLAKPGYNWKGAANMQIISYNLEMEFAAQCWSHSCTRFKDQCRSTSQFQYVGQNNYQTIEIFNFVKLFNKTRILELALIEWRAQIIEVKSEWYDSYPYYTDEFGVSSDFFQLIWASTIYVGCGRSLAGELILTYIVICNYAPRGAIRHKPAFEAGSPCTKCKAGTSCSNTKWKNLCGKLKDFETVVWQPPFKIYSKSNIHDIHFSYVIFLNIISIIV